MAKRESRYLDFKGSFDPSSTGEWVEIVKDLAAIANSGGGVIVIGANNDGTPTGHDVSAVLAIDSAAITDKMVKYTGEQFADFEIHELLRDGAELAVIEIGAVSDAPLVFVRPGTYPTGPKAQKTAFPRGTIYFRHGAKSEPSTNADLRDFIDRRVERIRRSWLGGVRKVVTAPADSEVAVLTRTGTDDRGFPVGFRLTDAPGAPLFGQLDPDETHPYLQKDAIAQTNRRLPGRARQVNTYDMQAVRAALGISETTHPEWIHKPKFGSKQYSDAFVDWFVDRHRSDPGFLDDARARYYEMQRTGR